MYNYWSFTTSTWPPTAFTLLFELLLGMDCDSQESAKNASGIWAYLIRVPIAEFSTWVTVGAQTYWFPILATESSPEEVRSALQKCSLEAPLDTLSMAADRIALSHGVPIPAPRDDPEACDEVMEDEEEEEAEPKAKRAKVPEKNESTDKKEEEGTGKKKKEQDAKALAKKKKEEEKEAKAKAKEEKAAQKQKEKEEKAEKERKKKEEAKSAKPQGKKTTPVKGPEKGTEEKESQDRVQVKPIQHPRFIVPLAKPKTAPPQEEVAPSLQQLADTIKMLSTQSETDAVPESQE